MSEHICNICKTFKEDEIIENTYCECNTFNHRNCLFSELIHFKKCLRCKFQYRKPDGVYTTYHLNGNINYEVHFVDEKKHGTFKTYYSNGVLSTYIDYVNDKKHGKDISFTNSGIISSEKDYKNNQLHGEFKFYYPNGVVKFIETYVKNKFISVKNFNEDGTEN